MTISGISNSNIMQQAWQAKMQQRKQDFSQLGSALQGGDLASAQKAFADLQSLTPGGQAQSTTSTSGSGSSSSSSPDLSQFASLFQGGDLTSLLQPTSTTSNSGSGSSNSSTPDFSQLASLLQGGDLTYLLQSGGTSGSDSPTSSSDFSQFASLLQGGGLASMLQPTGTTDSSSNAALFDFSSLTLPGVSNNSSMQSMRQQREQDFTQLGSALQSGDLASAQKAFTDLQSLSPGGQGQVQSSTAATTTSTGNSGNTTSNDFAALGQALQSGNLTDAQNAFAKVQSDMQAHKGGHHHHHGGAAASYAAVSNQTQSTNQTQNTPSASSTINVSA